MNIIKQVKNLAYDLSVILNRGKKKKSFGTKRFRDYTFMLVILVVPIINFLVLYVGVNFSFVLLSFQQYDIATASYFFEGVSNFSKVFRDLFSDLILLQSFANSLILFGFSIFVMFPISLWVSYIVYKKIPFAGFFRVVLFLPKIVSAVVWVIIFKIFVEYAVPQIINNPAMPSLIATPSTSFVTLLAYRLWVGLAGNLIIYTGAMSRVPDSLLEYGKLEGVNSLQEFTKIVLPLIFPTISVFLIVSIVDIFTDQFGLFTFFAANADSSIYTVGYYFFIKVFGTKSVPAEYPYAAAAGLVFTLFVAPVTYLVKYLLERFGPNEEY